MVLHFGDGVSPFGGKIEIKDQSVLVKPISEVLPLSHNCFQSLVMRLHVSLCCSSGIPLPSPTEGERVRQRTVGPSSTGHQALI